MGLTSDDIDQLICEVWAPSLELDLYHQPTETDERPHTAVLEATGGWTGHLVVRATESFAVAVAAKMFGMPRPEVDTEDAADAVGELANVVGGNLKSLLGEDEVDLGLPQVGEDVPDGVGTELARTVVGAAPGFEVTVVVVEGATVGA